MTTPPLTSRGERKQDRRGGCRPEKSNCRRRRAPLRRRQLPTTTIRDNYTKVLIVADHTRITQAALLREALEDLLARYDVKPSEAYDDLRSVLTDARALANKIAAHGHKEAATVQRAGRIRQVIDSVQDRFDRTWRFGK